MDLVPWLLHELFLQLYLVFTHSCVHEWSETCPCKTHKLPKCLLNCRTPEAISLYHNNILPDCQSYFRLGLVSVFFYLLCLLRSWDSRVNVSQFFQKKTIPLVSNMSLNNFTHWLPTAHLHGLYYQEYTLVLPWRLQRMGYFSDSDYCKFKARQYFTPKTFSAASLGVVRLCNAPWATLLKKSLWNCVKQHWQWTCGTCCHRRLWRQRVSAVFKGIREAHGQQVQQRHRQECTL